ncbi:hypothetical protein CDD81_4211 [Ophiocordyceps australis]|uniref:Probable glucan endo-1,3-beta-glucosidase eglC n=1 Tax=Ophiocordyceps australis TaxID=1399860 RepID=A0A2C5YAV5_9HYPO|nr:hypothetical protein CDD81_4211 [Ophiocordyceps australis]
MPCSALVLALAAAVSSASAAFQGFNYGSSFTDGRPKARSDFEAEFKAAAGLAGTNGGFQSARLFTMIQEGSANDPISAIPAAINTKTSLLFGMWCSGGDAAFNNELAALRTTTQQYCGQLDGLVAGISVGSEDLYRISPTGQKNSPDPGAAPMTLVKYIKQVRDATKGTCLEKVPIGHVDTWTAYVNDTNKPVIDALDWVGMDAYPYFEDTKPNSLAQGKSLFESALEATRGAAGGKDVWITETGWPVSGNMFGAAVPSRDNAKVYWDEVGCPRFGKVNIWWYTLQDGAPAVPNPSFGIVGSQLGTAPLYDLSCGGTGSNNSSTGGSSTVVPGSQSTGTASGMYPTPSSGAGTGTGSGTGAGSGTGSGSGTGAGSGAGAGSGSDACTGVDCAECPEPGSDANPGSGAGSGSGTGSGAGAGACSGAGNETCSGSGSSPGAGAGAGTGVGSTPGSTPGSSPGSAPGSPPGSTPGSAPGSGACSGAGTGPCPGSGVGSGPSNSTGPAGGAGSGPNAGGVGSSPGSVQVPQGSGSQLNSLGAAAVALVLAVALL